VNDDSDTSRTNPYAPPQVVDNRQGENRLVYHLLEACVAFATVIGICLGYILPVVMQVSGILVLVVGGGIMVAVVVASLRFSTWNRQRNMKRIDILPPTQNRP
jgi:hypothetical protein